jgi:hypothetical protein
MFSITYSSKIPNFLIFSQLPGYSVPFPTSPYDPGFRLSATRVSDLAAPALSADGRRQALTSAEKSILKNEINRVSRRLSAETRGPQKEKPAPGYRVPTCFTAGC